MKRRIYAVVYCLLLCVSILSQDVRMHPGNNLDILLLGDFNFGESYQTNPLYNRGINIIDEYGYDYMFENIRGILKSSDFTIANLETPLLDNIEPRASARKIYVHWSNSNKTAEYLRKYNITALSLANNHSFDFGPDGLEQTAAVLLKNKLDYFGAGKNLEEASKPLVKHFINNSKDTFTIAVLSGFEYRKSYDSLYNFYADENTAGVNVITTERIKEQVKELKEKHKNIFIVFFPHWGRNYFWKTDKQTETSHSIIDAGVDLIIGHGAHMIQEIEYYNGKWIVYSIGNSVFNAPGRYKYFNAKPYSFIAELKIRNVKNDGEKHLRLYPVYTDNLETDYKVRFLNEDEMNNCYNILKDKSSNKKVFNDEFRFKKNESHSFFEIQLN